MREFFAAVVLCAVSAAGLVGWKPYIGAAPNDRPHHEISASLPPPAAMPVYVEHYPIAAPIAPPTRAAIPKPKPLPQILLSESAKALGKGPRELGTRRDLWCADFFNKTLAKLGLKGTGSALASSFVHWGKLAKPGPGVIAVKSRHGGNHVVIIKAVHGKTVVAISPNSRGKVREMRYSVRQFYAFRVPA